MIKNLFGARWLLIGLLTTLMFSSNLFAKSALDSKMANEVRLSLWTDGIENEFQDAYSYYMEMLESDNTSHATNVVRAHSMPEELLVPLMEL